ncbi:MAG: type II secretion system protein [Acidimicrobiia bacterium]
MLQGIRRRLASDEGFTLIELMVVVLIIAVLIAIAIPSFIGFRDSAQDRQVQSDLRNALLAEKAYWNDNDFAFTTVAADLQAYEPSITLDAADPTVGIVVGTASVAATGEEIVCLTRQSESGTIFSLWEGDQTGTRYGEGSLAGASCTTTVPATHSAGGW